MPPRPRSRARTRQSGRRSIVGSSSDPTVSDSTSVPLSSSQNVFSLPALTTTAPAPRPSLFHSQQFSVTPSANTLFSSSNSAASSSTWHPDESIAGDDCQTVDPATPRANITASRGKPPFSSIPNLLFGGSERSAAYSPIEARDSGSVDFGTVGGPNLSSRARGKRPVQVRTQTTTASFLTPAQLFAHTQALQLQSGEVSTSSNQAQQHSQASASTRTATQEHTSAIPPPTYDDLHGSLHTATATATRAGSTRSAATTPPTLSVIIDHREHHIHRDDGYTHRSPATPSSYLRSRALSSASSASTSELAHALQPSGRIAIGTVAHSSVTEPGASIPTPTSSSTSSSVHEPIKETVSGYQVFHSRSSDASLLETSLQVNQSYPRLNTSHLAIANSNPVEKPPNWTTTYQYDYSPLSAPYSAPSIEESCTFTNVDAASQTMYNIDTQESSSRVTPHELSEIGITSEKLQSFFASGENEELVNVEAPYYVSPSPESLPRASPSPSSGILPSPLPPSLFLPSSGDTRMEEAENTERGIRPVLDVETTTETTSADSRDHEVLPEKIRRDHLYTSQDRSPAASFQITAANMGSEIDGTVSSPPDLRGNTDPEPRAVFDNTSETGFVVGDFNSRVNESELRSDRNTGVFGIAGSGAGTTSVFSSRPIRADGIRKADAGVEAEEDADLAPRIRSVHASRGMRACMSVFRLDPFSAGTAAAGPMTSVVTQQQQTRNMDAQGDDSEGGVSDRRICGLDGAVVESETEIEAQALSRPEELGPEKWKPSTVDVASENIESAGAKGATKRKTRTVHTSILQFPQAQREQYFQFQQLHPHQHLIYHQQQQQQVQKKQQTQNSNSKTGFDAGEEEGEAITYDGLPARPHSRPSRVFVHHLDAQTGVLRDGLPPPDALETLPAALDAWQASHESTGSALTGTDLGPGANMAKDWGGRPSPDSWAGLDPELEDAAVVSVGGKASSTAERVPDKDCERVVDTHADEVGVPHYSSTRLRRPSTILASSDTEPQTMPSYKQSVYHPLPSSPGSLPSSSQF